VPGIHDFPAAAHVDGTGRVVLDRENIEPIDGWAVIVFGKTNPNMIFTSEAMALTAAVWGRVRNPEIARVVVRGTEVERLVLKRKAG